MKSVIIPDIHNHIESAQWILDHEYADEYVFLGDFFDDFGDNAKIALKTAKWVKSIVTRKNCICLWSNHDVPYRWSHNRYVWCPGFDHDKCRAINSILKFDDWEKFRWFYKTQNWYVSHAGLHPNIFGHPVNGFTEEECHNVCEGGINYLNSGGDPNHCRAGFRMGVPRFGGCTWADWSEFEPIEGVNQLVGHTPDWNVRVKYLRKWRNTTKKVAVDYPVFKKSEIKLANIKSLNYCIDTANDYYAIINDGVVTIKEHELNHKKKRGER